MYKLQHLVENRFLEFTQWRGVATRYAKRAAPYPGRLPTPGSNDLE